jgi:dynein heavy chain
MRFDEINEKIRKPPKNIEELTDIKKYISEIPIQIEKLKTDINSCMDIYHILNDFNFEFSSVDLD